MNKDNTNVKNEMKDKLVDKEIKKESICDVFDKKETFPVFFNCSICFQPFSEGGGIHAISTLPCGHIFGKSCLVKWFNIQSTDYFCPTCKISINDFKLKGKDNVYESIIPLYGLTKNTSIETIVLSRQKLIDEYEEKIKELSIQNMKLKEQLNSSLRLRRETFSLRSFAIDREDNSNEYERFLNEFIDNDFRPNTSFPQQNYPLNNNFDSFSIDNEDDIIRYRSLMNYFNNDESRGYSSSVLRSRRALNFSFMNNESTSENINQIINNDDHINSIDIDRPIENHLVINNRDNVSLDNTNNSGTIENFIDSSLSLFSNERGTDFIDMSVSTRSPLTSSSTIYTTTIKYRLYFDEINDSSYSNGLIVSAVKIGIRNGETHNYGLSIFRYLRGSLFLSLSDHQIVSVKAIKDPVLSNVQRIIAVCNKGKFYNIKFDEENFRIISKFEGSIGQSQNFSGRVALLHKPTSLSWLTPEKYAIGTKRGHVFIRKFFENNTRWKSINRYTNTHGENDTRLKKPILMLQSINDHAVICFQLDYICIFDDRSGREVVHKCDGDILSINFNKYSSTLAVILGGSRNISQLKTLKIESVHFLFVDGMENYSINTISSTLHDDIITEKIELNSIVLKTNNVDTFATFWIDSSSENLSLTTTSGSHDLMNQINVDSSRIIKVCNEEGVYFISEYQKLNYMIVSTTNIAVYELGINSS